MIFKIKKGLEIPIQGKPDPTKVYSVNTSTVGILGNDFHGMKPTMLVKEDDTVVKGQPLFEDKKNPGVLFTAPVSGKVSSINRGDRRAFLSLVIEKNFNDNNQIEFSTSQHLSDLTDDNIVNLLVKSGAWTAFKTRPFSKVPKIEDRPDEIFISLIDSNPLSCLLYTSPSPRD